MTGQLGSGSYDAKRLTPIDVTGFSSGVSKIAAGNSHSCALISGGVKCWGSNIYGQIGDGSTTPRSTPVDVTGLASGVSAIATSSNHTCALTSSNGVKCWGYNLHGQLGDNSTTNRLTPVDVSGLTSGVIAISAGYYYTCALTSSGGLKCWGYNNNGQLGNGATTQSLTPVDVTGLTSGVLAISAGFDHGCALTSIGGVKCWGFNGLGELGDTTTTTPRLTPVDVSGLSSGVSAITTGDDHSCALTSSGGVKCWGYNIYGQLGNNTTTNSSVPVDVSGLVSGVSAVAAGANHNCALTGSGVQCWGNNTYGQVGNGSTAQQLTSVSVTGLSSGVSAIATGASHSCALTSGGGMKCWGYNSYGQIGDGTAGYRSLASLSVGGLPPLLGQNIISFGGAPNLIVGGAGNISATSSSNLAVSLSNKSPAVCSFSGSTVTALAAGLCAITADQAGNASYTAATPITLYISINSAPYSEVIMNLAMSWNLMGNSTNAPFTVASVFGDAAKVSTVWKWVPATNNWAFYSPALTDGGAAYAASKGYEFLTTINAGEGFWVNSLSAFTAPLPTGAALGTADFQDQSDPALNKLAHGWSLIATGDKVTPGVFNSRLGLVPSTTTPVTVKTLWAWDSSLSSWYFYAPSLEANGGQANYNAGKGYLNFGTRTLDPAMGFWVNRQ
jgi:alpha-tubulin suppressor-like RCC1 family protein